MSGITTVSKRPNVPPWRIATATTTSPTTTSSGQAAFERLSSRHVHRARPTAALRHARYPHESFDQEHEGEAHVHDRAQAVRPPVGPRGGGVGQGEGPGGGAPANAKAAAPAGNGEGARGPRHPGARKT